MTLVSGWRDQPERSEASTDKLIDLKEGGGDRNSISRKKPVPAKAGMGTRAKAPVFRPENAKKNEARFATSR